MTNTAWWLGLGVAGALLACDSGAPGADAAASDGRDGAVGADASDATTRDTHDAGPDVAPAGPPSLTSVAAQTAGAKGIDLVLSLAGADGDGDAELARVRLLDAHDQPVLAFSTSLGARPDSDEVLAALTPSVAGNKTFVAEVRLRGLLAQHPDVAAVEVALRDSAGGFSDDVRADVAAQAVRALGDACDTNVVVDRCGAGLGCRGEPGVGASCQEGVAPEIAKVAYLKGEGGTRILVQGVDPEEDVASVLIELLDNAGHALPVDLDNDDIADASELEVTAVEPLGPGAFMVRVTPVAGFEDLVPRIAVTATDAAGHTGERKTANLTVTPVRAVGQACDPNGFDACNPATAVCVATATSGVCTAKSQLAKVQCAAAPELVPGAAPIVGIAAGPSLWDAPATCSSGDPKGRPEGVAVLHLTAPASHLTLTTALAGTNFDSVVYLVPGCGEAPAVPLGCADDAPDGGAAATLELTQVPAGDYLVVVDAWGADGGSFALSASIE